VNAQNFGSTIFASGLVVNGSIFPGKGAFFDLGIYEGNGIE